VRRLQKGGIFIERKRVGRGNWGREASASSPMKELISRAVPAVVAVASKAAAAPAPGLEYVLAVPKDTLVSCLLRIGIYAHCPTKLLLSENV
jgi:hypothetical protein